MAPGLRTEDERRGAIPGREPARAPAGVRLVPQPEGAPHLGRNAEQPREARPWAPKIDRRREAVWNGDSEAVMRQRTNCGRAK